MNIEFFSTRGKSFINAILGKLQYEVIGAAKTLYYKGDYADKAYFINTGRVNFLYSKHNIIFK